MKATILFFYLTNLLLILCSCRKTIFEGTYVEKSDFGYYRDTIVVMSDSTVKWYRSHGLAQEWVFGNLNNSHVILKDTFLTFENQILRDGISVDTSEIKYISAKKIKFKNKRIFIRPSQNSQ